eukprot:Lithocolla_globosa_v1_NODE_6602_length_1061_cov_4.680915.p1 type:complete len:251 gc:universal NODE_6602_length_1061_cov_4.680915:941-189(-)
MVDEVTTVLKEACIPVVRDTEYLDPLGVSLRSFMKESAKNALVILFVNDAYLKSDNCIYEARQAMKYGTDKVFPIVYSSTHKDEVVRKSRNFFDLNKMNYTLFWQKQYQELDKKATELDLTSPDGEIIAKELRKKEKAKNGSAALINLVSSHISVYTNELTQEHIRKLAKSMAQYCESKAENMGENRQEEVLEHLKFAQRHIYPREEAARLNKCTKEQAKTSLDGTLSGINNQEIKDAILLHQRDLDEVL